MSSFIHSRPRWRRANAGLTILEVMVAIAVAGAGIFGALSMHVHVMHAMRAMHEDNLARQVLVDELETLKALPFATLAEAEGQQPFRADTTALDSLHLPTARVILQATPVPGLLEVRAEIMWIGGQGRRIIRGITTLIADHGRGGDG